MRKFILDIIIMTLIFIVINFLFYFLITHKLLFKDYELLESKLAAGGYYNKFILSDSHGWKITDEYPEISEKFSEKGILNLSYGSDSYGDCLVKLNWLINYKVKVDTILLTIDDHMITKKSNNMERSIFYSNSSLHKKVFGISTFKYFYYSFSKFFPIINPSNQRLISKYLVENGMQESLKTEKDVSWSSISDREKEILIKERVSVFFPQSKYSPNNKLKENLTEIVRLCNSKKIVLIGIKFPIDKMLISEYNRLDAMNKVKSLAEELGITVFFDYQMRFNDEKYLGNQDHVNAIGADSLSNAILHDLGY
jgi:hypothetical protein